MSRIIPCPSCVRAAGFTLLELLLAIAISAITASVLYAGLAIAFNARDAVTDELRLAASGRTTLELMRADLAGAARPTGILAGPFIGEADEDLYGRSADEMTFFTNSRMMPAEAPMGELQEVRFTLIDSADALDSSEAAHPRQLVRIIRANLLAPVEEQPTVQVLAQRVWSLELRYHDGDGWQDTWNSTTRGDTLPLAVEVTLRLMPEDVDTTASLFDLEESTVEVRRTFHLLKGTRDDGGQGLGR